MAAWLRSWIAFFGVFGKSLARSSEAILFCYGPSDGRSRRALNFCAYLTVYRNYNLLTLAVILVIVITRVNINGLERFWKNSRSSCFLCSL